MELGWCESAEAGASHGRAPGAVIEDCGGIGCGAAAADILPRTGNYEENKSREKKREGKRAKVRGRERGAVVVRAIWNISPDRR